MADLEGAMKESHSVNEEEEEEEEEGDEDDDDDGDELDLGSQGLTKIQIPEGANPRTLLLNDNDITKLDGIEACTRLTQLSIVNNRIVRMSGLHTLTSLTVLSLSNNSIHTIEGLEALVQLTWLDLSSNSIKVIEHLPKEGKLHYLDLSDNDITHISDLSSLARLKTLLLHSNSISSLKPAASCLPQSLEVISLADNSIYDLNEICHLSGLSQLQQLSISDNPCVLMTGDNQGFDYRPFVWNWCPTVHILDAFVITEKERLLGEWLYSQGKGRHFHPGEHVQLVEYLATVCPLTTAETLRTEEESKLSHILSQQRRYQQQLQQQPQQQQQTHHHHQQQHLVQAASDQISSPRTRESHRGTSTADSSITERDSSIYPSHSVDSNSEQTGRRHVWANPADLSVLSHSSGERPQVHANDLTLQDVSNDCDARSSVSLLESESVYLPFDVPASPVVIRRPFTAPENQSHAPARPIGTTSKPQNSSTHPPRPQTAADSRPSGESKYDSLEQRPIRPLNQNLAKGNFKPNFDVARPLTSNSEPSVSTHKDSTLPTACSQDYESSSEQTASESEAITAKPKNVQVSPPSTNIHKGNDPKAAPKDKLNLIKLVAGSKKAGQNTASAGVREKTTAAAKVRGTSLIMKTSSTTNTTTTTTTASSMAASALIRARMMKTNTTAGGERPGTAEGQGPDTHTNTHPADRVRHSPNAGRAAHAGGGDSKQVKARLNLERMELRKDGSTLGDSGFLSRPASDAVIDETQQIDNKAATAIQAFWRGYWTREHNTKVVSVRKEIRARRAEDHIMLLRKDLERNRKLYEEEKRLRILQMEAIRLLYHEVQVLKSHSLVSSKDLGSTDGRSSSANTTANFSPTTTAASNISAVTATAYSELNRTQELERTCASLQSQVSHLQEALESVSSAVFRTNSLDSANFDFTDHSDAVQVTPYADSQFGDVVSADEANHWSCIPHSLSPYPSEEEELYYRQVPAPGVPTPPRRLQLQHHSRTALLLSWQPSCCGQDWEEEEEGNRHIIGYRVYVNDQLKAFICQRTSVLVEGLNPSTTYKFYVKALSGFGESFESNIIMAKLAVGPERHKYPGSSGSDSSHDSDKDVDSTENNEKLRRKNRKLRKSPRSSEKKRSSKSSHHHRDRREAIPEQQQELSINLNSNNSAIDNSTFAILTQPKLHTHRRNRSRDLQTEELKDSPSETTSKESSPSPGTVLKAGEKHAAESQSSHLPSSSPSPSSVSTTRKESSRKLPESPKRVNGKEDGAASAESRGKSNVPLSSKVGDAEEMLEAMANAVTSSSKKESPSRKKESPPSGSGRHASPSHHRRREDQVCADGTRVSPHTSPSCGSESEGRRRSSPKAGTESSSFKVSSHTGSEDRSEMPSSSFSETFTVDKASSFLESVSAITEQALGGRTGGSPSSGSRGHRRTRSRDYQQQVEKGHYVGGDNKESTEQNRDILSVEEASRLGIGRSREKLSSGEGRESSKKESDGANSDSSGKVRTHRRKRSKDLNSQVSDWNREDGGDGTKEERKDENKTEDESAVSAASDSRDPGVSSVPVIDGRRRHSSGSRPNSPVVTLGGASGEEKTRMSIAEIMMEQKAKNLNKSSSLNSLSGRSEDSGPRSEIHKKSPSIESLPNSSRGDGGSKRTISNESLLSGGSSRGESSKRTHSSESLMSIRTDTSKRSHSNESLPGSARTDTSRRSPSNESLPESIREETELEPTDTQADGKSNSNTFRTQNLASGCRRTQSMGSARDIDRKSGSGGSNQTRGGRESTNSVVSKLLLKLESITRNNSTAVKEKKESLIMKKSSTEDKDSDLYGSKPPSDDERKSGRRSRNLSESDAEGTASDAGSQLPPRAPSESSSGSHSDDNRHSRRSHRRTPSDHRPPTSLPADTDPTRPTHSPIIMEGGMMKKSSSNVRRNQSFHGLLPSKHQDTKTSPSSNEDISPKAADEQIAQAQSDTPVRPRSHLRSRTPSPARGRQPILSAAQLKRHSEGSKLSQDSAGKPLT